MLKEVDIVPEPGDETNRDAGYQLTTLRT